MKRAIVDSDSRLIFGPGGEIGRHKGLKIPRRKLRAGSSPAPHHEEIFITGSAGFIGFHLAKLLDLDCSVLGYDSVSNYYDSKLKESRLEILNSYSKFTFKKNKLENYSALKEFINLILM